MKIIYTIIAVTLTATSLAQDISFTYSNADGVTQPEIIIKKDTKQIILTNAPGLKKFVIAIQTLAPGNRIIIKDRLDEQIGDPYSPGDGNKAYQSQSALNNNKMSIYLEDSNNQIKLFAGIMVLDKLPESNLDIVSSLASWKTKAEAVCTPCAYDGRSLTFDFADKSLTRSKRPSPSKVKILGAKVGKPFMLIIKNINPFRDSIIISQETANYNTDVPDIFTKAFFSTALKGENDVSQLLADVLELGNQVDAIINSLKNSRECDKICEVIQNAKNDAEAQFKNYGFDPSKKDLVSFLADELQNINEVYKDKVAAVLAKYQSFINTRNYFNYLVPQVQNVDEYIFTLSILPKSGEKLATNIDHQPISVKTVGGFKFDFSSGLFMTGLRDQQFTLKPDSTVIQNSYGGDSIVFNKRNQIIKLNDNKKVDFGVSALMHCYPRITPYFNVGLSLGAGVSVGPDPSIRYLGGVSFLFGKSGRLSLTYGCAAGFIDALADGYQNLQYTSQSDAKVLTKKVFRTRSFWGIGFNIPLFKSTVDTGSTKTTTTTSSDAGSKTDSGAGKTDSGKNN